MQACTAWPTAACSAPASARATPTSCRTRSPTSSSPAVGEELGLTGLMAMLVLYAILVERGLRTALAARDVFGRLLACGLAFVVGAAGVRRRRRRHQPDPADRPHDAVPVARAAPRWSRTGSSSRCCCGSATRARRPAAAGRVPPSRDRRPTPGGLTPRSAPCAGPIRADGAASSGCCSCRCWCNVNLRAGRPGRRPGRPTPATTARSSRSTASERGADPGRRQAGRALASTTGRRRLQYQRTLRRRPAVRPRHRLLLPRLRRDRHRAGRERGPVGHRHPAARAASSSTCITGRSRKGGSVAAHARTPQAQQAADDGAAGKYQGRRRRASSPSTGAILALVTSPSLRPEPVVQPTTPRPNSAAWDRATRRPADQPLLNRAARARPTRPARRSSSSRLPPRCRAGSTRRDPRSRRRPARPARHDRDAAERRRRGLRPARQVTLEQALQVSCNTAFANLGLDLGARRAAGAGREVRLQPRRSTCRCGGDQPVSPSDLDSPQTAQAAIGQFDVRATPLQMAMVAAGDRQRRRRDAAVHRRPGARPRTSSVLDATKPTEFGQAVTPEIAQELTDMMVNVVEQRHRRPTPRSPASRWPARPAPRRRRPGEPPHAWFVSFAPADDPQVAVAVVVEDGGNLRQRDHRRQAGRARSPRPSWRRCCR